MKPRLIISQFFLACALSALHAADADTTARKTPLIGLFVPDGRYCGIPEFREGLREYGYIEGRNIVIECRHAGGRFEDAPRAARELIRMNPDVIVARTHPMAEVALQATRDIPIVTVVSGDPVAAGWATSLARPGGNLTGLTYFAWDLYAKRLELLKAVVPNLKRVGLLVHPSDSKNLTEIYLRVSRMAAKELGLEVVAIEVNDRAGIERALEAMANAKIQAVHVLGYLLFGEEAQLIADLAMLHNLPTMHFLHEFPSMGGLMGYGPDYPTMRRRMAQYVDKILKGAKPADLPIEQPARFVFSINLATAYELGLKVPPSLLARADKVIE
ncbi:MAG TPA: ABC transporter substrate-binding protein [Acidiferrobacterales bacterium]|nr:ABC transporter substrate-binding protein [Acidiferrobacterales bacterium]